KPCQRFIFHAPISCCATLAKIVPSAEADSVSSLVDHPALPCRAFTFRHFVAAAGSVPESLPCAGFLRRPSIRDQEEIWFATGLCQARRRRVCPDSVA